MAKKELDTLLESYFAPKEDTFGLGKLQGLIKEMYVESRLRALQEVNNLHEEGEKIPARTYTIKEIPYIPISELGWANNDAGEQVASSQRSQLEDYLANIPGDGFEDKLAQVMSKMTDGFGEIPAPDDDTGIRAYIQEVMSHLVFYKTLTMAITNFNASAAGFNFEAFLSALMTGQQIPASGANTIADFTSIIGGESVPVSLKLYTEGQLKVGGSFTDLANDLMQPNEAWSSWASKPEYEGGAMRYLVCTKEFEGQDKGASPLERTGKIFFYQFDITRANVFRYLAQSKKGAECLALPAAYLEELKAWDGRSDPPTLDIPTKTVKDPATVDRLITAWQEKIKGLVEPMTKDGYTQEQAVAVANAAVAIYRNTLEYQLAPDFEALPLRLLHIHDNRDPSNQAGRSYTKLLVDAVAAAPDAEDISSKQATSLAKNAIAPLFAQFKEETARKLDQRAEALSAMEWRFARDGLVEEYEALPSPNHKLLALKNSKGYLNTMHWELGDKLSKNLAGGTPLATIEIGAPAVKKVLDQVSRTIMQRVFDVFENMQVMAESLNTFFANGLQDVAQGKEDVGVGTKGVEAGEKATDTARDVGGLDQ